MSGTIYMVRRADPDDRHDREAIERLWDGNLPSLDTVVLAERFDWLYHHNPAGRTLTWLAIDTRNETAVGCASVLPREMVIDGRMLQGGIAIDFAIEQQYRSFGIALQLQRAIASQVWEQGIELMFCFPNKASRGVFQRVGYKKAGKCWRGAQLLRSFSKLRQHGYSCPVAMIAGFGIDMVFSFRNTLALLSEQRGMSCAEVDAPDERWDIFWSRILPDLWFGGAHHLDYLRWRYQQCPFGSPRFFCLFDKRDNLLGYIIFSRQKKDVLMIDDFQVLDDRLLKVLLARFWKEMRKTGATAINISVVGSDTLLNRLGYSGFVAREVDGWAGMLAGPGLKMELPVLLESQRKWYLADAEVDL